MTRNVKLTFGLLIFWFLSCLWIIFWDLPSTETAETNWEEPIAQVFSLGKEKINLPSLTQEPQELNILIPKYIYNSGFESLKELFKNEKNIILQFHFQDSAAEYYEELFTKDSFSGIDLALIPYDRTARLSIKAFAFRESISPFFLPIVEEITNKEQISLLPFALDPLGIYTYSGTIKESSFSSLAEYVLTRDQKKPYSFPIFLGAKRQDSATAFSQAFEYQSLIWQTMLNYAERYNDNSALQSWIDINILQQYVPENIKTILEILSPQVPHCSEFPSLCLLLYRFTDGRFGFLSDLDIITHFFANKSAETKNLTFSPLPFSSLQSPLRLRGRVIPNQVINQGNAYLFLQEYMTLWSRGALDLWGNTISAFSGTEQSFTASNFILEEGETFLFQQQNHREFWQLLDFELSAKDYLQSLK